MDETPSTPNPTATQLTADQNRAEVAQERATEHRESYGTAKTENLRDTGRWRILLPGFVVLCCLAVLAIPLIILGLLVYNSPAFIWVWLVMLLIEVGIAAIIIRGLVKIFMTQAGNY
jgi:hypothetical protein